MDGEEYAMEIRENVVVGVGGGTRRFRGVAMSSVAGNVRNVNVNNIDNADEDENEDEEEEDPVGDAGAEGRGDATNDGVSWCARRVLAHLCTNMGLCFVLVVYVLCGGFMFEYLESGHELQQRTQIQQSRDECLKELWTITERLNVLYERNWTKLVHEQLRKFETSIVTAVQIEGFPNGQDFLEAEKQWSFSGAIVYSVTIITTIGYGNLAPKTTEGKIMTMLYALIGVPLMLICLSSLGSILAESFQFIYSYLCCVPCSHKNKNKSQDFVDDKKYTYHKAHSAPSPNHHSYRSNKRNNGLNDEQYYTEMQEFHQFHYSNATLPRKTMLATVNSGNRPKLHTRALRPTDNRFHTIIGINSGDSRQLLSDYSDMDCSSTPVHVPRRPLPVPTATPRPPFKSHNSSAAQTCMASTTDTDMDETDENQTQYVQHDTPSRVPLIWKPPDGGETSRTSLATPAPPTPHQNPITRKIPIVVVLFVLAAYICLGAAIFSAWEDWSFLDGAYFCFTTLSTIGFGDFYVVNGGGKAFQSSETLTGQLQLIASCVYLIIGLILVAMSFSLIQEEVVSKCRRMAGVFGLHKPH